MGNLTGEVLNLPDRMEYYKAIWTVVAAVAVVVIWGPKRLSRHRMDESPRLLAGLDKAIMRLGKIHSVR
jgi:hypothetical protein